MLDIWIFHIRLNWECRGIRMGNLEVRYNFFTYPLIQFYMWAKNGRFPDILSFWKFSEGRDWWRLYLPLKAVELEYHYRAKGELEPRTVHITYSKKIVGIPR